MNSKNYKRELTLKTGQVKRLCKEFKYYTKELQDHQNKAEVMKANGSDEYSIKKQGDFIQESSDTLNSLKGKVKTSIDDLSTLISEITDEQVKSLQEYTLATNQLAEANQDYENFK